MMIIIDDYNYDSGMLVRVHSLGAHDNIGKYIRLLSFCVFSEYWYVTLKYMDRSIFDILPDMRK